MGSDHGAVEHQPLQIGVFQLLEDPQPDPLSGPAIEPPPGRIPVAEAFGQVTPGCPGLSDPEDGIEEKTVVRGGHAGVAVLSWQEVLDAIPVFIRYLMATHD